ncbi:hypothetical protein LAZ67_16000352 [Cordylochernes scorpioides]|uniref:Uncharacterized protein n=1 Tax=Cordylochernes scorpioides TaxID=51811 RepID=A0ABY6LD53_9ARAC|nr:hypothetical protein LAZ67_16000352 [Cordylochernes scorpioides]
MGSHPPYSPDIATLDYYLRRHMGTSACRIAKLKIGLMNGLPRLDFKSRPDPEGLFIASMTTAGVDVCSAMPDVMCSGLAGES